MKILEIYTRKLRFKNYSKRTIDIYVCYLEKFLKDINCRDPYQVTIYQITDYLEQKNFTSRSQQNQYIGSLKLFSKYILGKKALHLNKIERPKKQRKQPKVIDAELLATKIKDISNLKHRAILTLGLSCGLRVSEVINLKWEHLDRHRNVLKVVNGKGQKDRSAPLNDSTIELLEAYWREFKSKEYVFNGQISLLYSQASIQKLVKKYIDPSASYHLLRHSYATYAIDNGTELKPLSVSMGHNSTKTVEKFYFHQSNRTLKTIKQAL